MGWKKNLTLTTLLTGSAAIGIHLINKAIYLSSIVDNKLNNSGGNYYDWKFGKIFYEKTGEGKPLLLVHDLSTFSSAVEWKKVIKIFSQDHTVYTIDLLGCGRSDKPNITYTNFLYVQMITDFIKNVIKEKTDIAATGLSGSFVLGACHNDHDVIDNIILINPTDIKATSKGPTKSTKTLTKLINLPLVGTLLYNILTTEKNIQLAFSEKYYYDCSKIDDQLIKTYYEAAHCGNASSKFLFASICGYYTTANISLYLEGLNNSIFIIVGEKEENQMDYAKQYQTLLPSVEIIEIENTKYLPHLEQADEFTINVSILLDSNY